jgi:hypothetical protein
MIGALLLEQNDEWAVQRARYQRVEKTSFQSNGSGVMLMAQMVV